MYAPIKKIGMSIFFCVMILIFTSPAFTYASDKAIISINTKEMNQSNGQLFSSINVTLPHSLVDNYNGSLKQDIFLVERFSLGNSVLSIEKNKFFEGFNTQIQIANETDDGGDQFLFPFDKHHTKMNFIVGLKESDGSFRELPYSVDCMKCVLSGVRFIFEERLDSNKDNIIYVTIKRSVSIIVFCLFISALMMTISSCILVMAIRLSREKYRPETSTLGFIGGLLFAIPAVRNLQPGVPPFGTAIIDYLGFIEAEIILVMALVITIYGWIKKPEKNEGKK